MRRIGFVGLGLLVFSFLPGCAGGPTKTQVVSPESAKAPEPIAGAADPASTDTGLPVASSNPGDGDDGAAVSGSWIGAAAEGEMLAMGTTDTAVGVWVDVPRASSSGSRTRPPMELALVIDTSGSMAGAKIDNARAAATRLAMSLHDGDIVALDTFSDAAHTVVPPTVVNAESRRRIANAIRSLSVSGSTNMFDGLTMAEGQVAASPTSHSLRRVVVISDGIANVGPSSPEVLGAIAERGMRSRAQVTSLGVGNDYDERTLNALAVRSSGRLYHISEPREMASILRTELDLIDATVASDAFVEIVAAPGVQLLGADGVRADRTSDGGLRIPLGALHAGQHREALVRVRLTDPGAFAGHSHPLASVRLRFRDARDGDLERVQETVARTQLTEDTGAVATHVSSRTKAIALIQETARIQMAAAQQFNAGAFSDADRELARAEKDLAAQAAAVTAPADKKRVDEAQKVVAAARATAQAAPSKPKAAQRAEALDMNASGMRGMGF